MSVMLIRLCLGAIPSSVSAYLCGTVSELFSPLSGADEDGSSGSGSEGDDSDDEDDDEDDEDDTGDEAKVPADKAEAQKLAKKNAKLRKRLREANGREQQLQKEKETAAKAGGDETERLRGEVQTLTSRNEELSEQLKQGSLKQAFLESNKVQWHNPATAFKLLDTSDIDIDEDGDTSGMEDAIEQLSKDHPYLIKSSGEKQEDKEKDGKGKSKAKGSSGEGGTKGKGKSKDNHDREALRKKYPALQ